MKVLVFVSLLGISGCVREPVEWICPEVGAGELIVSELRGPQSSDGDSLGEWIELYNASGRSVDMQGVRVTVTELDGSSEDTIVVRTPLLVAAGDFVVLGRFLAGDEPSHIDYGYAEDFNSDMSDSGAIEIMACGVRTDLVVYRNLPSTGSHAFGGGPDADQNDEPDNWCTSIDELGSPGEENPTCI